MKIKSILFFLLFYSQVTYGQSNEHYDYIDSLLLKTPPIEQEKPKDEAIISILSLLDEKIDNFVDTTYEYLSTYKHTIISVNSGTKIKYILNENEAIDILKKMNRWDFEKIDSLTKENKKRYIQGNLIPNSSSLQDSYIFFDTLFVKDSLLINPLRVSSYISSNNLIYHTNYFNIQLNEIIKKLNEQEKENVLQYIFKKYDGFSIQESKFEPKAISIPYLIIGKENIHYAGIDIYGQHYLWKMDLKIEKIIDIKPLWMY